MLTLSVLRSGGGFRASRAIPMSRADRKSSRRCRRPAAPVERFVERLSRAPHRAPVEIHHVQSLPAGRRQFQHPAGESALRIDRASRQHARQRAVCISLRGLGSRPLHRVARRNGLGERGGLGRCGTAWIEPRRPLTSRRRLRRSNWSEASKAASYLCVISSFPSSETYQLPDSSSTVVIGRCPVKARHGERSAIQRRTRFPLLGPHVLQCVA